MTKRLRTGVVYNCKNADCKQYWHEEEHIDNNRCPRCGGRPTNPDNTEPKKEVEFED